MYTVHPIPYYLFLKNILFNGTVLLNNLATYVPHGELTLFTVLYIVVVVVVVLARQGRICR